MAEKEFTEKEISLEESITPQQTVGFEDVYEEFETLTNKVWIDGKKVWRQVLSFGALPNNTNKTSDFPTAVAVANLDKIVNYFAVTRLNFTSSDDRSVQNSFKTTTNYTYWSIYYGGTNLAASCTTNYNATTSSAWVVVEYTRNDK